MVSADRQEKGVPAGHRAQLDDPGRRLLDAREVRLARAVALQAGVGRDVAGIAEPQEIRADHVAFFGDGRRGA